MGVILLYGLTFLCKAEFVLAALRHLGPQPDPKFPSVEWLVPSWVKILPIHQIILGEVCTYDSVGNVKLGLSWG